MAMTTEPEKSCIYTPALRLFVTYESCAFSANASSARPLWLILRINTAQKNKLMSYKNYLCELNYSE